MWLATEILWTALRVDLCDLQVNLCMPLPRLPHALPCPRSLQLTTLLPSQTLLLHLPLMWLAT